MNADVLADSRIPLLDRVTIAGELMKSGNGPLCLYVGLNEHDPDATSPGPSEAEIHNEHSAYIVRNALDCGWQPVSAAPSRIDPARWLKALASAPWANSGLKNAALRALEGRVETSSQAQRHPVVIISRAGGDPDPEDTVPNIGIQAALRAGWQPDRKRVAEALSFSPELLERCPALAAYAA